MSDLFWFEGDLLTRFVFLFLGLTVKIGLNPLVAYVVFIVKCLVDMTVT